jgi:tetratricopeptide (TPR) repeat protein
VFLAAPATVLGAADFTAAQGLVAQGYRSLMAGETTNAISAFSEAIESRELPADQLANALLNRGLAHQQAAQYRDAVADYEAALRIDALSADLRATGLYNRGLAYQKLGAPALAIEDFTSALLLDPEFAHAYFSRATVLRESGQYLFAINDYEKALRFNHPQSYLIYYGKALAHQALNHTDLARRALTKALAIRPGFAPARQKLALLGGPDIKLASLTSDQVTGSITPPEKVAATPSVAGPPPDPKSAPADSPVAAGKVTLSPPTKLYADRVPQEEVQPPPPAYLNRANQKLRKAVDESDVKVVAIERLPDADPVSGGTGNHQESEMVPEPTSSEPQDSASPELTGWSIQLSSAKDEKLAWGIWSKLKSRHGILAEQKPVVVRADLGSKGVYYRLRLGGFDSQGDAKNLCAKLKSRGLSCFVSKMSS